ncbi:MAG: glycosyltransferase family 39 protein [Gemmatimonadota bacterium]|nr:MAG: glycosyltransferase family 39 protein [Gemmatimonadota bacterium]
MKGAPSVLLGRSVWVTSVLILAIAAALALRFQAIGWKYTLTHDEGISYLAATCHQRAFHETDLRLRSVPAIEWKRFLQVEDRFCYGTISADLATYDIHPPLYFWMLHSWSLLFGVQLWTGPSLNSTLAVLTILALFGFARQVLKNDAEAVLVAFTYALSPAIASVSIEARQYDLLALLAVLLVWQTWRVAGDAAGSRRRELAMLAAFAFAGSLTHYHFALVVVGCCVFLFARLKRKGLLRGLGALGVGYLLGFLVYPPFGAFGQARRQAQPFDPAEIGERLRAVISTFEPTHYLFGALAALIVASVVARRVQHIPTIEYERETAAGWTFPLIVFLGIGGAMIALYLAFLSPVHAMGPKYLSMAWPFFAFAPVALLRTFRWVGTPLTVYLYSMPLVFGFLLPFGFGSGGAKPLALEADAQLVLIDNSEAGILPGIVWQLKDETPVIAAMEDSLLANVEVWLPHLDERNLYISHVSYRNTLEKLRQLLGVIHGAGYDVEPLGSGSVAGGLRFAVRRNR